MKIAVTSDLHGFLPKVPKADLLVIGGDIQPLCNMAKAAEWYRTEFNYWLMSTLNSVDAVVATPGNHDFIFQQQPHLIPSLKWYPLIDHGITLKDLKIYGTPWQPVFFDWAFNLTEEKLEEKFSQIPEGLDVLVTHGPPYGAGDKGQRGDRLGSNALRKAVLEKQPKLVVCGHIHPGRGEFRIGKTIVVNASAVNEEYKLHKNPIQVIEL